MNDKPKISVKDFVTIDNCRVVGKGSSGHEFTICSAENEMEALDCMFRIQALMRDYGVTLLRESR
jgi:hypothetical protein